ncbi:MAG: DUF3795 domain-containing protein [Desulfobacteraceae bacterium]|nr:DUF3795 domain-containing protein [Desulfobacteraceae bacterium]
MGTKISNDLIAYCGLYCGACSFKVAFDQNEREHIKQMPEKYNKFRDRPLEFCPGCRLENHCGKCDIKDFAEEKKVAYCSRCSEFPCEKLTKFNNDGIPHHSKAIENLKLLEKIGVKKWLASQGNEWTCGCGTKYSWYLKSCKVCSP